MPVSLDLYRSESTTQRYVARPTKRRSEHFNEVIKLYLGPIRLEHFSSLFMIKAGQWEQTAEPGPP